MNEPTKPKTDDLLRELSLRIYNDYSESTKNIGHGLLAISIAIVHLADTAKEISEMWCRRTEE